jgi:hypothetical protein
MYNQSNEITCLEWKAKLILLKIRNNIYLPKEPEVT